MASGHNPTLPVSDIGLSARSMPGSTDWICLEAGVKESFVWSSMASSTSSRSTLSSMDKARSSSLD